MSASAPTARHEGPGLGKPTLLLRALEFGLLFGVLPYAYVSGRLALPLIPTLLGVGAFCTLLLLADPSFDRRRLGWGPRAEGEAWPAALRRHMRIPLVRLLLALPVLIALTWAIDQRLIDAPLPPFEGPIFLAFPRRAPFFWALVMLLYPLLSVYPQELIFRTFLFHRYAALFPWRGAMVGVSALLFGVVHVLFALWPAFSVGASAVGGLLFARTYQRSGSTLAASLEHGLYGDLLFTLGLGVYFVVGMGAA